MKSFSTLVVLLVIAVHGSCLFAAVHATLVADDRDDVLDSELERLINTNIATNGYGSMILAFTQCFGEDCFDDFAGYGNTALLSGSQICHTSQYGGYHRGLARNLVPGSTTNAAHAAADAQKGPGDTPVKAGTNENIGTLSSTHVLVWAGKPNWLDQADIDNIHDSFDGCDVTVLSGNGTGQNVDGAANRANLQTALKNIGSQMNSNEQFILFVTDHGDKDDIDDAGYDGSFTTSLNVPAYAHMQNDSYNQPVLSLFSDDPIAAGCFESIEVNGHALSLPPESFEMDYDDDGTPEEYKYMLDVDETWLSETANEIDVQIDEETCPSVVFTKVSLGSGAISRTPQEGVPVLSNVGLIAMALFVLVVGAVVVMRRRVSVS